MSKSDYDVQLNFFVGWSFIPSRWGVDFAWGDYFRLVLCLGPFAVGVARSCGSWHY